MAAMRREPSFCTKRATVAFGGGLAFQPLRKVRVASGGAGCQGCALVMKP